MKAGKKKKSMTSLKMNSVYQCDLASNIAIDSDHKSDCISHEPVQVSMKTPARLSLVQTKVDVITRASETVVAIVSGSSNAAVRAQTEVELTPQNNAWCHASEVTSNLSLGRHQFRPLYRPEQ